MGSWSQRFDHGGGDDGDGGGGDGDGGGGDGDGGGGDGDGGGGDGDGGGGDGDGGGGNGGGDGDGPHDGMPREVVLLESPASEMSEEYSGVPPSVHMQHGSPSSRPLLWPSPSVSASHSTVVQT